MEFDINKYLKNKDGEINNDNIDFNKMVVDARKGYVEESSTKDMVKKSELDELSKKYSELETNYNNQTKTLEDTTTRLTKVDLENKMLGKGFKSEQFDKVAKIRTSIYGDEKDDLKALEQIANDFKGTFFAEEKGGEQTPPPKDESGFGSKKKNDDAIKITRGTKLSSLLLKK